MTYCVGVLLREGLVMLSDTRTNAGIDNIACFRKLHIFEDPGKRVVALATSGNLSISQSVMSLLTEGFSAQEGGEIETLEKAETMFQAAQIVGRALRKVYQEDGAAMEQQGSHFDVSFLLGGQIGEARPRLYMIYAAGNFIEATSDTPFLQIGETKYGKPIFDRAVTYSTDLYDALKIGLISMDSTMRSNLAVGLPIDLLVLRRDELKVELRHRIEPGDRYFEDLRHSWSEALKTAHRAIPRPSYGAAPDVPQAKPKAG
jgi:putative proteasome-type protease